MHTSANPGLWDGWGRRIDYLRLSVTDRCDFRCIYCMAEQMRFLPKNQILSLDELRRLAQILVQQGIKKIRITGGEPLLRQGIVQFCAQLRPLEGLEELVLTTNGSQLHTLAHPLAAAGVQRLNISLDSIQPHRFRQITRHGDLAQVLRGIDQAQTAGFQRIKLNAVIMRGHNDDEILPLLNFALERQLDISFIEEMPLGNVGRDRHGQYCSSDVIQQRISQHYLCTEVAAETSGPSRQLRLHAYPHIRVGLISPHSHNFCGSCNRIRLTVEGRLLLCLGNEHSLDLRALMRKKNRDDTALANAIAAALQNKPKRHHFHTDEDTSIVRFMNASGG